MYCADATCDRRIRYCYFLPFFFFFFLSDEDAAFVPEDGVAVVADADVAV